MPNSYYRGRFAPSPSGGLHLGSLVTALAAHQAARAANGTYLVRLEDIDSTRCRTQYSTLILAQLAAHGLESDEPVLYQSLRHDFYSEYLLNIIKNNQIYACFCTRAEQKIYGKNNIKHQNICQNNIINTNYFLELLNNNKNKNPSLKLKTNPILAQKIGYYGDDLVVYRADGIWAYHWVCVLDDFAQNITHIVRGEDLADSQLPQNYLQAHLGFNLPEYQHIPLVLDANGRKFSKQNHAPILQIDPESVQKQLAEARRHLGFS